jgi:starch phosphorylase
MPAIHEYNVVPVVPERLAPLKELAYNLHWTWNHEIFGAFRWLDQDLWQESGHNPVYMLGAVSQKRLDELAQDDAYLTVLDRCSRIHEKYMTEATWYENTHGTTKDMVIAYFAAEFGLTECLPIYSGGLGVLSGDHLKSSSELGIPLVGVGLLYQHGYFRQYLNADGWQQELHPENDHYRGAAPRYSGQGAALALPGRTNAFCPFRYRSFSQ